MKYYYAQNSSRNINMNSSYISGYDTLQFDMLAIRN